jgi:drug/metabolite transporter (DMT)-like permease
MLATIASAAGNLLIIFAETPSGESKNYFLGVLFALACSLSSSFYQVAIVKKLKDCTIEIVMLFLGLLGASELVIGTLVVLLFHYTGYESL